MSAQMPAPDVLALSDRTSEVALVLEAVTEVMRGQRELLEAARRIERSIDELRSQVQGGLAAAACQGRVSVGSEAGPEPPANQVAARAGTAEVPAEGPCEALCEASHVEPRDEFQEAFQEEPQEESWSPPTEEELLRELERVVSSGARSDDAG